MENTAFKYSIDIMCAKISSGSIASIYHVQYNWNTYHNDDDPINIIVYFKFVHKKVNKVRKYKKHNWGNQ
jgi:hypothetical protein